MLFVNPASLLPGMKVVNTMQVQAFRARLHLTIIKIIKFQSWNTFKTARIVFPNCCINLYTHFGVSAAAAAVAVADRFRARAPGRGPEGTGNCSS